MIMQKIIKNMYKYAKNMGITAGPSDGKTEKAISDIVRFGRGGGDFPHLYFSYIILGYGKTDCANYIRLSQGSWETACGAGKSY